MLAESLGISLPFDGAQKLIRCPVNRVDPLTTRKIGFFELGDFLGVHWMFFEKSGTKFFCFACLKDVVTMCVERGV